MPVGRRLGHDRLRFTARNRHETEDGLAIGGVPAVLIAAYVVKSLPLVWVRWLVVIVVVYAGTSLFRAASRRA